jgi:hypothetical protein
MANNGDELPPAVVEEIIHVGGLSASDAWSVGEEDSTSVHLADTAVDWIEAVANGETPPGP